MGFRTNVQTMMKYLGDGNKWIPKQNFKNCKVSYEKIGTFNGEPTFKKIVERKNGTTVTGHFQGSSCYGVIEENTRGRIDTSFAAINYDKVTQIETSIGDSLTRLGHKDNPTRYIDTYRGAHDTVFVQGDFQDKYNKLIETVRNPNSWNARLATIVAKFTR